MEGYGSGYLEGLRQELAGYEQRGQKDEAAAVRKEIERVKKADGVKDDEPAPPETTEQSAAGQETVVSRRGRRSR